VLDLFWSLLEFDPDQNEEEEGTLLPDKITSGGNQTSPKDNKEQI
jgi:hypothetical protein